MSDDAAADTASWSELVARFDEREPKKRSITVMRMPGDNALILHDDPKFSGGDNCPSCRFSRGGCRVHQYFRGPIEDCKLWNRTDPAELGPVIDWRRETRPDADSKIVDPKDTSSPPLGPLPGVEPAIAAGRALEALALLCRAMRLFKNQAWPSGFLQLAKCLFALHEGGLARLCLHAAESLGELLDKGAPAERAYLDEQLAAAGAGTAQDSGPDLMRLEIAYRDADFPVLAYDCRLREIGREKAELSASSWADLATLHRLLGELSLAELAWRRAILLAGKNLSQRQGFEQKAAELAAMLEYHRGNTLDLERRTAERVLERASRDEDLRSRPAGDPRVEQIYWLRTTFLEPTAALARAVLARASEADPLLALPGEHLSQLAYRIAGHAGLEDPPRLQDLELRAAALERIARDPRRVTAR